MENQNGADSAQAPLSVRIEEAAEILNSKTDLVAKALSAAGIDNNEDGLKLLESGIVGNQDIETALSEEIEAPFLKMRAAASTIFGHNPFKEKVSHDIPKDTAEEDTKDEKELSPWARQLIYEEDKRKSKTSSSLADSIAAGLKEAFPNIKTDFKQLNDKDLLQLYIDEKDYEVEMELSRRAKHQYFVVLGEDKNIDVEASLDLLKRARRMVNPSIVPVGDSVVPVYRITELNPEENIIELCPLCGEVMYKGYCSSCESNFAGIGEEERAYVRLIANTPSFNERTFADRRYVLASATKGLEDLYKTWPSLVRVFEDLKLTNSLPKLKKIRTLPSVRPADPFNVKN